MTNKQACNLALLRMATHSLYRDFERLVQRVASLVEAVFQHTYNDLTLWLFIRVCLQIQHTLYYTYDNSLVVVPDDTIPTAEPSTKTRAASV